MFRSVPVSKTVNSYWWIAGSSLSACRKKERLTPHTRVLVGQLLGSGDVSR